MNFVEITDDSGFLGVVDPDQYESFVAEAWNFSMLRAHFVSQMQRKRIILWEMGLEGTWRVAIKTGFSTTRGFRETVVPIDASSGHLCLVNYETLTMAAQYSSVTIPEAHLQACRFQVSKGAYECRVVQMFDPDDMSSESAARDADFLLEFALTGRDISPSTGIIWGR